MTLKLYFLIEFAESAFGAALTDGYAAIRRGMARMHYDTPSQGVAGYDGGVRLLRLLRLKLKAS